MRLGQIRRPFHLMLMVLICIIIIVIVGRQFGLFKFQSNSSGEVCDVAHPSLNDVITNQMSELEQTKRFDRDIKSFMRRWEMVGASFALMRNDSLIYAKGYGYADKDRDVMCDVGNVFRIASVSKLITASAIMKLREEGKLSLSDKVFGEAGILNDSIFLNFSGSNHSKITVEHLLRHTSGLHSPFDDPAFANYSVSRVLGKPLPLSVDNMVEYATKCRVKYSPGDRYEYSNMGYIILGKVIERVSGEEYESYVRHSILEPAGCYNMFIGHNFSENLAPNEVKYYEVKEAKMVEAYDGSERMTMKSDGGNNVTLLSSAGGWVASSVELLRFVAAINNCPNKQSVLSKESIGIMTKNVGGHPIGWASVNSSQWLRSGSMAGTSALIKSQGDGYTWVFIVNNSAWIGPKITRYISSRVSTAISKVKEWPDIDMFGLME